VGRPRNTMDGALQRHHLVVWKYLNAHYHTESGEKSIYYQYTISAASAIETRVAKRKART
jgi:hypothetical protein